MKSIKLFAIDIDGTITIDDGGTISLEILSKFRYLVKLGYKIIYVTGRSSIEAFILSVFGGTTRIAIGENGGVITKSYEDHMLLANKEKCLVGYDLLLKEFDNIELKSVHPRMTEIVLNRTFDVAKANKLFEKNNLDLIVVDSTYAFHINEKKINKAYGLQHLLNSLKINPNEVVAIGDSETDIPLFNFCKNSVTFESSANTVKEMAKFVVKGENGDGIINAIDLIIRDKTIE
ncbi:MAG TPA: phosphoglycolate phosphatase [Candidatus Nitrosocosmicus sp.]